MKLIQDVPSLNYIGVLKGLPPTPEAFQYGPLNKMKRPWKVWVSNSGGVVGPGANQGHTEFRHSNWLKTIATYSAILHVCSPLKFHLDVSELAEHVRGEGCIFHLIRHSSDAFYDWMTQTELCFQPSNMLWYWWGKEVDRRWFFHFSSYIKGFILPTQYAPLMKKATGSTTRKIWLFWWGMQRMAVATVIPPGIPNLQDKCSLRLCTNVSLQWKKARAGCNFWHTILLCCYLEN